MSNQQVVDFDQWCLEESKKSKEPKQLMCSKAIIHFKNEFHADFIRKHTHVDYKQKFRQSNAKKRDYNKSKLQKLKSKLSINTDDFGVLLSESFVGNK